MSQDGRRDKLITRVNFRSFLSRTSQRHRELRERAQRKIRRGVTIWITSLLAWGLFMVLCIILLILVKLGYVSLN